LSASVTAKRLAMREYAPLVAIVLTWGSVAAAGPADAVRLLAAVTFVRAARSLTAPAALGPLRTRLGSPAARRQATEAALGIEAAALAGALAALGAILALLWAAGQDQLLLLCLLFAPALPVRSLLPLTAARSLAGGYRLTLALLGLVLAAAGWAAGADIDLFALLLVAREWLALPIAYALAPRVQPVETPGTPLEWREIAAHSHALGRRRVAYRFSRLFLQAFLGPFGGIAARTGRGMQLDGKFARFVPDHPAALAIVAVAAAGAAGALILLYPEPVLLVLAASLMRTSAAAANVLLWRRLSRGAAIGNRIEDDDED